MVNGIRFKAGADIRAGETVVLDERTGMGVPEGFPPSTDLGPTEKTIDDGSWNDIEDLRQRALVLDLAGATHADVEAAWAALGEAVRVRNEWNYFTSVITRRIAERQMLLRQLTAPGGAS